MNNHTGVCLGRDIIPNLQHTSGDRSSVPRWSILCIWNRSYVQGHSYWYSVYFCAVAVYYSDQYTLYTIQLQTLIWYSKYIVHKQVISIKHMQSCDWKSVKSRELYCLFEIMLSNRVLEDNKINNLLKL